jgi:hypothetical protein
MLFAAKDLILAYTHAATEKREQLLTKKTKKQKRIKRKTRRDG